jgi:hypothetical protein
MKNLSRLAVSTIPGHISTNLHCWPQNGMETCMFPCVMFWKFTASEQTGCLLASACTLCIPFSTLKYLAASYMITRPATLACRCQCSTGHSTHSTFLQPSSISQAAAGQPDSRGENSIIRISHSWPSKVPRPELQYPDLHSAYRPRPSILSASSISCEHQIRSDPQVFTLVLYWGEPTSAFISSVAVPHMPRRPMGSIGPIYILCRLRVT